MINKLVLLLRMEGHPRMNNIDTWKQRFLQMIWSKACWFLFVSWETLRSCFKILLSECFAELWCNNTLWNHSRRCDCHVQQNNWKGNIFIWLSDRLIFLSKLIVWVLSALSGMYLVPQSMKFTSLSLIMLQVLDLSVDLSAASAATEEWNIGLSSKLDLLDQ